MIATLHKWRRLTIVLTLIWHLWIPSTTGDDRTLCTSVVRQIFTEDSPSVKIMEGVTILRDDPTTNETLKTNDSCADTLINGMTNYARSHKINVNMTEVLRVKRSSELETARFGFGKNSFLTGFGLGFLAFGLKKLLLPIFIGAQIVKSILIAMFLPSILGSVGKLVGKGVTSFAQSSGSSNFGGAAAGTDNLNDFDFKDTAQTNTNYDSESAGSDSAYNTVWAYPTASAYQEQTPAFNPMAAFGNAASMMGNYDYAGVTQPKPTAMTRYTQKPKDASPNKYFSGSFYTKDKTEDFKVFHNIPTSSHLLANYDPFYSPLLSRIDSVFKQLGYSTEPCRERLVCNMYKNPAKYAPFSNLISAQLSRELDELRKPSSDNPEILRFFRYMKAAKDGQDGQECDVIYSECTTNRANGENAPMVSTFNEINKLVQARKI